jgi:hypothetical protein
MVASVKVLGGMFVLGRIAAANVAALKAQPEVQPGVAHCETFLAACAAGRDRRICFLDVLTNASHDDLSPRRAPSTPHHRAFVLHFYVPVMEDTGSSTRRRRMEIQKLPAIRLDGRSIQ